MEQSVNNNYGLLINKDTGLYKGYFKEMCRLIGVNVKYRAPKKDKHWTVYAEIESNYEPEEIVSCIFEQYTDQRTMKKIGWISELDTATSMIHLPYDLHGLQVGALVSVPSGLNDNQFKLFRITKMSTIMIYPYAVSCQIVPEYEDTTPRSDITDFRNRSMTMMLRDEDDK